MHEAEQRLLAEWIRPQSRVLDLGCGDGSLLAYLRDHKAVRGYGVELQTERVLQCLAKGIPVIQSDLDEGIARYFAGTRFDFVVMSATLPAMFYPRSLLQEMLAIGQEVIVSFPNMGHWRCRFRLWRGFMPQHPMEPQTWYNNENIRLFTISDFETFCRQEGIQILERRFLGRSYQENVWIRWQPFWFSTQAFYRIAGALSSSTASEERLPKKQQKNQEPLIESKE